jgi:hypothetical protein
MGDPDVCEDNTGVQNAAQNGQNGESLDQVAIESREKEKKVWLREGRVVDEINGRRQRRKGTAERCKRLHQNQEF